MLNGNIFIPHLLCLIFCMDQNVIQILTDISLASLDFRSFSNRLLYTVYEKLTLDTHFFKQF